MFSKSKFLRVVLPIVLVASVMSMGSVPASAAVPPDGSYECSSGVKDAGIPAYTITNGQIDNSSGRSCSGPLTIAPGVTGIGIDAFLTSSITSVVIPNTVIRIEPSAFDQSNLSSITFESESQLNYIGWFAFYGTAITELTLPNSLQTIAFKAFKFTQLSSLTIPDSIVSLGEDIFADTSSLSEYCYNGSLDQTALDYAGLGGKTKTCVVTPVLPTTTPAYYPFGPQLDVTSSSVLNGGWELCWSGPYNGFAKFSELLSDCTGEYILYTGWEGVSTNPETIPDTFAVLAAGPRSEVFRDTTNVSTWTVTEANGSYWSFGDDRQATGRNAVGFSDASNGQPPLVGTPCFDGALSICWHSAPTLTYWDVNQAPSWGTDEAGLSPGWSLNGLPLLGQSPSDGGANHTRAIFQSVSSAGGSSGGVDSTAQSNTQLEKAAREALIAEAQVALSAAIAKGETVTIQLLRAADLFGPTNQNIAAINADIALLSAEQKQDFMAIRKIVIKHATVDAVASKRPLTFSQLVETGITTQQEGVARSIIMRALSALPSDQIDTVAKINKAITEALAAHQVRKDRINAVSDRTAARNLG